MPNAFPKLHNAMWPGLVGKEPGTDHPPISLDRMLELTAAAEVNGQKFEGVDLFLFHPHTDPDASEDDLRKMADKIAAKGLAVGSLVAPVWLTLFNCTEPVPAWINVPVPFTAEAAAT